MYLTIELRLNNADKGERLVGNIIFFDSIDRSMLLGTEILQN